MMLERDEKYLAYVERHRKFVLEEAMKLDVGDRGLVHDLSKYEPDEFDAYADYFYGGYVRGQVPLHVQAAFDRAWLRHQKRNDHHWQYWVLHEDSGDTKVLPMTEAAVREMIADWRGAGRAITGADNTVVWFAQHVGGMLLHPDTHEAVERLLRSGY